MTNTMPHYLVMTVLFFFSSSLFFLSSLLSHSLYREVVREHRKRQSAQRVEDTVWSQYFPGRFFFLALLRWKDPEVQGRFFFVHKTREAHFRTSYWNICMLVMCHSKSFVQYEGLFHMTWELKSHMKDELSRITHESLMNHIFENYINAHNRAIAPPALDEGNDSFTICSFYCSRAKNPSVKE